jgi:catechol 2,3-dioxygenase-like lactoylglutathione lyase family enzyme
MKKQDNPRIAHLAVKVEDAEAAADFYKELFGFTEVSRHRDGDHVSLHLTDGHLDLALVQYDTSDSMMGNQAGPGYRAAIEAHGGETFGDPTNPDEKVLKFRVPGGGGITEIAPFGFHSRKSRDR